MSNEIFFHEESTGIFCRDADADNNNSALNLNHCSHFISFKLRQINSNNLLLIYFSKKPKLQKRHPNNRTFKNEHERSMDIWIHNKQKKSVCLKINTTVPIFVLP